MAETYTYLAKDGFNEGQPIRAVQGLALRNNLYAMAEGATGAPKIQTIALQPMTGIANYKLKTIAENITSSTVAYSSIGSAMCLVGGDVYIKIIITSNYHSIKILKNNVQVYGKEGASSGGTTLNVIIPVDISDVIVFQTRNFVGSSIQIVISEVSLWSGTKNIGVV